MESPKNDKISATPVNASVKDFMGVVFALDAIPLDKELDRFTLKLVASNNMKGGK